MLTRILGHEHQLEIEHGASLSFFADGHTQERTPNSVLCDSSG